MVIWINFTHPIDLLDILPSFRSAFDGNIQVQIHSINSSHTFFFCVCVCVCVCVRVGGGGIPLEFAWNARIKTLSLFFLCNSFFPPFFPSPPPKSVPSFTPFLPFSSLLIYRIREKLYVTASQKRPFTCLLYKCSAFSLTIQFYIVHTCNNVHVWTTFDNYQYTLVHSQNTHDYRYNYGILPCYYKKH